MRLADIADRLQQGLPAQTDRFSTSFGIQSITALNGVATIVTTEPHGLIGEPQVAISNIETRTPITAVSSDGFTRTFTTGADHDLTEEVGKQVNIDGLGIQGLTFGLASVPNRRTFSIVTANEPTIDGDEFLLEPDRIDGLNGIFKATPITKASFTIEGDFADGEYAFSQGRVALNPRVGVCVDVERAREIYDEQPEEFWCFVIPADANVSKDRNTDSDAIAAQSRGTTLRLRMLENFAVMVFAPVSRQLAAEEALDICRHELLGPIIGSLFGFRPNPGTICPESEFQIIPTGHLVFGYDKAVLVYAYEFQAPFDLVAEDKTFTTDRTRAFRDANYAQTNLHEPAEAAINLDDEPL